MKLYLFKVVKLDACVKSDACMYVAIRPLFASLVTNCDWLVSIILCVSANNILQFGKLLELKIFCMAAYSLNT